MRPNIFSRFIANQLSLWALNRITTPPSFIITSLGEPYLRRWHIIPRNRWFNIYLHHYEGPDIARALHDHPWWNFSFVICGEVWELTPHKHEAVTGHTVHIMTAGASKFRLAVQAHKIVLPPPSYRGPHVTLFITGPRFRKWGFWCRQGWRPHDEVARIERSDGRPHTSSHINTGEEC